MVLMIAVLSSVFFSNSDVNAATENCQVDSHGSVMLPEACETSPETERWSFAYPLLADRAEGRLPEGVELPKPFGINLSVSTMDRETDINDLNVKLNGERKKLDGTWENFELGWLNTDDLLGVHAEADASATLFRLDTFVTPFLNVYGLIGQTRTETTVYADFGGEVGPLAFDVEPGTALTYGFGASLSAGWKQLFAGLDATYSYTDMDGKSIQQTVNSLVATARLGYYTQFQGSPATVWLSGTYWGTQTRLHGTLDMGGACVGQQGNICLDDMDFNLEQGPVRPWTVGVGSQVMFDKDWMLVFQMHSDLRRSSAGIMSLGYRF